MTYKLFPLSMVAVLALAFESNAQTTTPATADTWVNSSAPTSNYDGDNTIHSAQNGQIALIRFATPTSKGQATLTLTVKQVLAGGPIQVFKVVSDWNSSTVNWNNRPQLAATPLTSRIIQGSDRSNSVTFDVSAAVTEWVNNPATNFGLALVAGNASANIRFNSLEKPPGPALTVTPLINRVTVKKSGGDYSDPIVAAKNAFSGDNWCVSPQPLTNPCVMEIGSGLFILPETLALPLNIAVMGIEKSETVLVAAKGVELAVNALGGYISDLTIINHQDGTPRAIGLRSSPDDFAIGLNMSRIAVHVQGALANVGFQNGGGETEKFENCDVTAVGGQVAVAIDGSVGFGTLRLTRSKAVATDASQSNTGIKQARGNSGGAHLDEAAVVASGGASASGVIFADEEGGFSITNSIITASSNGTTKGVDGGSFGLQLPIMGSTITATGPAAVGISFFSTNGDLTLDGVYLQATGSGIAWREEAEGQLIVLRSQITADSSALNIEGRDALTGTVEGSILRASQWAQFTGDSPHTFQISDSVLDGTVSFGVASASCTSTYDGNYDFLGSNCLPAP